MLTFGTIALEQFLDKLSSWPNYVNLLYSEKQNLIKSNPKLSVKIEEKYNEIFNKNKLLPPTNDTLNKSNNATGPVNQYASNYLNFEGDKKNNVLSNNNLSAVPKMAKVPEGVFFNNYNTVNMNKYPYNMTPSENQFVGYIPGQTSVFKQGQINQPKGKILS